MFEVANGYQSQKITASPKQMNYIYIGNMNDHGSWFILGLVNLGRHTPWFY